MRPPTTLQALKKAFTGLVRRRKLGRKRVVVWVKPLTPEEAIGRTRRKDYPILRGRERVIEASVLGGRGQAFTDSPADYRGTLAGVLRLPLQDSRDRALFTAVVNAVCGALRLAPGTLHCRDADPERCGRRIASDILAERGRCRVCLVGNNPAIAASLAAAHGRRNLRILDLDPERIGGKAAGVLIEDGEAARDDALRWADLVLLTGTTLVNGTLEGLLRSLRRLRKPYRIFGITISGAAALLKLPRTCPYGRDA